jgi:hypothetical protein
MAEFQNRNLRIDGLRELNKKLRAAGDESADLPNLMQQLGQTVIANARAPQQSGELAASLRAGRGRTKAVVRAGYARKASYAGVIHYGNPNTGTRAQPFLVDALRRAQPALIVQLEAGLGQLLKKHNL